MIDDPYNDWPEQPESPTEPGLRRPPRWLDSRKPWDDAEVEAVLRRLGTQFKDVPSCAFQGKPFWLPHDIVAAANESDLDFLVRSLLFILPTYVADGLKDNGIKKVDQARIECGVSEVLDRILGILPRLATMHPWPLKAYLRKRCKSWLRQSLRREYIGRRLEDMEASSPHGNWLTEPVDTYVPHYHEAKRVLTELTMRLAPSDLYDLLRDILRGTEMKDAIRKESDRRKGRPGFATKDENRRAGIVRELAALGAIVAAASPDWALAAWSSRWETCLVAA